MSEALVSYRATPYTSTGYSPIFLTFGRETRMEYNLAYGVDEGESQVHDSYGSFVSVVQDRLWVCDRQARKALGRAVKRNKEVNDLRARTQEYPVGTWVWHCKPRRRVRQWFKSERLFSGPLPCGESAEEDECCAMTECALRPLCDAHRQNQALPLHYPQ